MIVIIISGKRKGQIGTIKGDLCERQATLGTDGKVIFRSGKNLDFIRCDNLREATAMERELFK